MKHSCLLVVSVFLACGCAGGGDESSVDAGVDTDAPTDDDTNTGGDTDTDSDTDVDTDTDTDADTDTDTDTESDTDSDSVDDQDAGQDAGSDAGGDADPGESECNGNAAYCDRPYNEVSVVCTHNAMSNAEDWPLAIPTPNQEYSFSRQLDEGVRCMMLDTYEYLGAPSLCHSSCILGNTPWIPMLEELAQWLNEHPNEIVTFILEAYIDEETTKQALIDGSVFEYVYHHGKPPGSPWPTLKEMIERNERLVVFTDDETANGDWHLDWLVYGWETPYDDDTFTCADNRGDPTAYDNQVFILNHYTLCTTGGCAINGETDNAYEFMLERATECSKENPLWNPWGHIPTFLNVDHYEVPTPGAVSSRPDVFDVADAVNLLWTPWKFRQF